MFKSIKFSKSYFMCNCRQGIIQDVPYASRPVADPRGGQGVHEPSLKYYLPPLLSTITDQRRIQTQIRGGAEIISGGGRDYIRGGRSYLRGGLVPPLAPPWIRHCYRYHSLSAYIIVFIKLSLSIAYNT